MSKLGEILRERGPIHKVGVAGMGYVGIPSAVLFAEKFDFVLGFQRNSKSSGYKIEMLNSGLSPLKGEEPGLEELIAKVRAQGRFECTSDFSRIREMDAITVAIQTPFKDTVSLEPDFSALEEGLRQIGRYLNEGMLVVLESTITPGTTGGMAADILHEESGLVAGEDFALAHAPERVMVGRLIRNIQEHDRIVGGIDKESTERAIELYKPVLTKGRIIAMDSTAAEVTKTAENTFRDLQIAAINELALYCEAMRINVYDVRAGIDSLKGEGITRAVLHPGAGVGGHCLTKDTYHLERGVRLANSKLDYPPDAESLYVMARNINDFMPIHMYNLTSEGLSRLGKRIEYSRIAILGWAFINNSDDTRNTPAEQYYNMLIRDGATVSVHDPYVSESGGIKISRNMEDCLRGASAVAIFTGHSQYSNLKADMIKKLTGLHHPVIVDGRNVIDPDSFINEGFVYRGIGRGDKNYHYII
ncbi:nucleotide sugar dehydrogenase [Candidatus Methanoperedens nitroreducens]|uniref:UDP-N-acetyl-D-mannosamine dehydrogenase n=1 Tax=Candidatus Methanoperedens nitratireducens TaxID=1392998 RepID=A0A062V221_9EURY|nr:nucleotide sugar dehydrogenase [Candidatus Methanoperedens nitroreducens]KCZ70683.1 nucleotide sugar dehydrogenase [Candidatus Methanoperedens nitroreducens]MDJ1420536.1 nucleotide sugar dehydrogenase [Candidatus Methanoperedens sp.]